MVDVNKMVREILKTIDDVTVTFYHPDKFNDLPIISYYELTTSTGMCYDDEEQAQATSIQIDIWGKSGAECSRLAIQVDKVMQNNDWYREMSRDMPPENGVSHKTMRYYKQIFFEN